MCSGIIFSFLKLKISDFVFIENINPMLFEKIFVHNFAFFAIIDLFVAFFMFIAGAKPVEIKNLMADSIFWKI